MKKKLLTLAVAAALAAPAIASAEAIMYGKLNMSVDYFDINNEVFDYATTDVIGEDPVTGETFFLPNVIEVDADGNPIIVGKSGNNFKGWTLNRGPNGKGEFRANRLGVKGSEDLGNGLKAIYQIEFGVRMANEADNYSSNGDADSAVTMRNSFVGLAGDWGTFLVGRHDTPLKISTGKLDLFADTMADYNGTVGFNDIRADNAIAYISPSWVGLQFAGAVVPGGGHTVIGERNLQSDSIAEGYSLALIYKNGPFYGSAAYEVLGNQLLMGEGTSLDGRCNSDINDLGFGYDLSCGYADDDFTKWRIGLGLLDWNGFTLTAIYEDQDQLPQGQAYTTGFTINPDGVLNAYQAPLGAKSQQLWQVQAGYSFGNMMIKGMYGSVSRDSDQVLSATRDTVSLSNLRDDLQGDLSTWAVGFDYNFSKRTTAYALYTEVNDDNADTIAGSDWSGFSLGMMHSF